MWTKQQKLNFSNSFYTMNKYTQLNNKRIKYGNRKHRSGSEEKKFTPLTKLTKSFYLKDKNQKISFNSSEGNTIDINISVNYHNKEKIHHSQDNSINNSSYKKTNNKVASYSVYQSCHKRNESENLENHIFPNNLNITLTNIGLPKTNNSYLLNHFDYNNNNIDGNKAIKSISYGRNQMKNYSNFLNGNNNIHIDSVNINDFKNKLNESYYINPNIVNSLKIVMNEKLHDIENKERDFNVLNNKKFDVLQSSFYQYANMLNGSEKDLILNMIAHIKRIYNFKNEQIEELEKENRSLTKQYFDLKKIFLIEKKKESSIIIENKKNWEVNSSSEGNQSSIEEKDLESIRFFDKIKMRTNSISHSKIPKLNLNFNNTSKIENYVVNKKGKVNSCKYKNNNNINNIFKKSQQQFFGYSVIAEKKKQKNMKKKI